jgi:hypothetical protein
MDCFVAIAPLRKRFVFVAGNDDSGRRMGGAQRYPSAEHEGIDGYRFAHPSYIQRFT